MLHGGPVNHKSRAASARRLNLINSLGGGGHTFPGPHGVLDLGSCVYLCKMIKRLIEAASQPSKSRGAQPPSGCLRLVVLLLCPAGRLRAPLYLGHC